MSEPHQTFLPKRFTENTSDESDNEHSVSSYLGRLSGGSTGAASRSFSETVEGTDSPGERFRATDDQSFNCGGVEVRLVDEVGYRGNGTFYRVS